MSDTPETDYENIHHRLGWPAFASKLERERDQARLEAKLLRVENNHNWQANDLAEQAFRERDEAREQNEEQARLLAMSADREEKMRDALKYIAGLDTSQGASPQQCSAVAVAMEALQ